MPTALRHCAKKCGVAVPHPLGTRRAPGSLPVRPSGKNLPCRHQQFGPHPAADLPRFPWREHSTQLLRATALAWHVGLRVCHPGWLGHVSLGVIRARQKVKLGPRRARAVGKVLLECEVFAPGAHRKACASTGTARVADGRCLHATAAMRSTGAEGPVGMR